MGIKAHRKFIAAEDIGIGTAVCVGDNGKAYLFRTPQIPDATAAEDIPKDGIGVIGDDGLLHRVDHARP